MLALAMLARVDLPAEAHLAEVERRLQLSTTGRPARAAAAFNRTEGAMSMATGLVLEPELVRPAAAAGQGWAGQGRAGQGWAGQGLGRAGQ